MRQMRLKRKASKMTTGQKHRIRRNPMEISAVLDEVEKLKEVPSQDITMAIIPNP